MTDFQIIDRTSGVIHFDKGRVDADGRYYVPTGLIYHIMEGSLDSTDQWFHNTKRPPAEWSSTHFGVGKDGRIFQWVRVEDTAWGNGVCNFSQYTPTWVSQPGVNPNLFTVSIELEGHTGDVPTPVQWSALMWLTRYLLDRYKSIRPANLARHRDIDIINRPFCPGAGVNVERIMQDINSNIVPATLPYGATVDGAGAIHINNQVVNYGIKDSWLSVFGAVKVDDLAAAILRSVRIFGLPVESEVVTPTGARQRFERYTFEFDKNENNPDWKVRGAIVNH